MKQHTNPFVSGWRWCNGCPAADAYVKGEEKKGVEVCSDCYLRYEVVRLRKEEAARRRKEEKEKKEEG